MTRIRIDVILLLCAIFTTPALAGQRSIAGRVILIEKNDDQTPAVGVDVAITQTGDSDKTKANGLFRIFLRDTLKPGEPVTITVTKKNWRIWPPQGGQTLVPADPEKTVTVITLLQAGSRRFLSDDGIQGLLDDAVRRAKEQVRPAGSPLRLELGRYIKDWAVDYGFSVQQVLEEVERWVDEVQRKQDDLTKLALAAYAAHNLPRAYELASESALAKIKRREAIRKQDLELTLGIVRDLQLAGDVAYTNYDFRAAVQTYERALEEINRDTTPLLWAETEVLIGNAAQQLATRAEGEVSRALLAQAVASYHAALDVCSRSDVPRNWAIAESNLGNALQEQGKRSSGDEGRRLLLEAVRSYSAALEVLARSDSPRDRAMTQNDLGAALAELGMRSAGEERQRLFREAVMAYRAALGVRTRRELPQDWAATQNNLGVVLRQLGTGIGGTAGQRLLEEAVVAYRAALEVRTRGEVPQDWAMTQSNLGSAQTELGTRSEGEAGQRFLSEAVAAYRAALEVYTRNDLPQDWAATQTSLGIALQEQGKRAQGRSGELLLRDAVAAHRAALGVYTRRELPQQWASTQSNLAAALKAQGMRSSGADARQLLADAVASYRASLEVFTAEADPTRWLEIQRSLISVAWQLEDWETLVRTGRDILRRDPNDAEVFSVTSRTLQGKLYRFEDACALIKAWLESHPSDVSARADFAECHVTTGRFADAASMIDGLLGTERLELSMQVALRALRTAALIGEGDGDQASSELRLIRRIVSAQPNEFKVTWDFAGAMQFVSISPAFSLSRPQLLKLLEALEGKDRSGILVGLDQVDAAALAR